MEMIQSSRKSLSMKKINKKVKMSRSNTCRKSHFVRKIHTETDNKTDR